MGSHNFPHDLDIRPLRLQEQHVLTDQHQLSTLKENGWLELEFAGGSADVLAFVEDQQQEKWIADYGIAGRIWEAALFMARYLTPPSPRDWYIFDPPCSIFTSSHSSPVIIELGSGNGFLSHYLSKTLPAGSTLYLTDLAEVVPLLEENATWSSSRHNGRPPVDVQVRPLPWGDHSSVSSLKEELTSRTRLKNKHSCGVKEDDDEQNTPAVTHILCSDLVYFSHLLKPLLKTLVWLTQDVGHDGALLVNDRIEVLFGCERDRPSDADKLRSLTKETPFWESFGVYFDIEVIDRMPKGDHRVLQNGLESDHDPPLERHDKESDNRHDDEEEIFLFSARRKKVFSVGSGSTCKKDSLLSPVPEVGEKNGFLRELHCQNEPKDEYADLEHIMDMKDEQFEQILLLRSMRNL